MIGLGCDYFASAPSVCDLIDLTKYLIIASNLKTYLALI